MGADKDEILYNQTTKMDQCYYSKYYECVQETLKIVVELIDNYFFILHNF